MPVPKATIALSQPLAFSTCETATLIFSEAWSVILFNEVRQLVDDDIIDNKHGRFDESPIYIDVIF